MARSLSVIVVVALLSLAWPANAGTPAEVYNEANGLYQSGEHGKALELYNSIDVANPDLEYNRAAAYFKAGELGKAVVHFNRALRLRPGDEDAIASLEHIRSVKIDRESREEPLAVERFASSIVNRFSLGAMTWSAIVLYLMSAALACGAMLAGAEVSRRRRVRAMAGTLALLALIASATAYRIVQFERTDVAVAVADAVDALAAPSDDSDKVFTFHEGTEVNIGRVEGDFVLVTLPNGVSGWADRTGLERI